MGSSSMGANEVVGAFTSGPVEVIIIPREAMLGSGSGGSGGVPYSSTMSRMRSLVVLGCCALLLGACARVKPHERKELATDVMDLDGDAREVSMEEHVLQYREGSVGGRGGGGSGCGCN